MRDVENAFYSGRRERSRDHVQGAWESRTTGLSQPSLRKRASGAAHLDDLVLLVLTVGAMLCLIAR